jgi:LysM repeat protein
MSAPYALTVGQVLTLCYRHKVVSGESVLAIAQKYGLKLSELLPFNPDLFDTQLIYPNQEVCVMPQLKRIMCGNQGACSDEMRCPLRPPTLTGSRTAPPCPAPRLGYGSSVVICSLPLASRSVRVYTIKTSQDVYTKSLLNRYRAAGAVEDSFVAAEVSAEVSADVS